MHAVVNEAVNPTRRTRQSARHRCPPSGRPWPRRVRRHTRHKPSEPKPKAHVIHTGQIKYASRPNKRSFTRPTTVPGAGAIMREESSNAPPLCFSFRLATSASSGLPAAGWPLPAATMLLRSQAVVSGSRQSAHGRSTAIGMLTSPINSFHAGSTLHRC